MILIISNTFLNSICLHVSMQHGKLFTETYSGVLNSERNHNTFTSVKGHIGKQVMHCE